LKSPPEQGGQFVITMSDTEEIIAVDKPKAEPVCWHLKVQYDGTEFYGWQVQPKNRTVQGEMRTRLRLMLRNPELKVFGSSRTDAGVHALDQQVSFETVMPKDMTPDKFPAQLNRWLPDDILLKSAEIAPPGFNARYDNFGKAYTYCISPGVKINPIFARYVWRTPKALDIDAMREAASYLVGENDFASFAANAGREIESTVRNLHNLDVLENGDGLIYINAVGDSFLYKMVRSLTGYLVHVGAGHAKPEEAKRVLAAKNRSAAADSAPAQGLFLAKVFLREGEWRDYKPVLPPFKF